MKKSLSLTVVKSKGIMLLLLLEALGLCIDWMHLSLLVVVHLLLLLVLAGVLLHLVRVDLVHFVLRHLPLMLFNGHSLLPVQVLHALDHHRRTVLPDHVTVLLKNKNI